MWFCALTTIFSNIYRREKEDLKKCSLFFSLWATCPYAVMRTDLVPASSLPLTQQQHCFCHRHSVRDDRPAVTANCHTSPLLAILFPLHICLLTFLLSFPLCFKHGRVNLLILQAASISIYLSSCFPPLSLAFSQAGLRCQALPEQWGCQEWWMTINLLLSSTTLLGDLQARWLPGMKTNLSFPFFPPFLHLFLPRSFNLAPSISTSPFPKKTYHNKEMCAKQYWNLRVDIGK